jgi:hypothetical protein
MKALASALILLVSSVAMSDEEQKLSDRDTKTLESIDDMFTQQLAVYQDTLAKVKRNRMTRNELYFRKISFPITWSKAEIVKSLESSISHLESEQWVGSMPAITYGIGNFGKLNCRAKLYGKVENGFVVRFWQQRDRKSVV